MKKRSMLAVASLAAGVVTALVTPSSHAVVGGSALPDPGSLLGTDTVNSLMEGATDDNAGSTAHAGGETVQH
ncbi:hypothetical protein [Streptomyces sp. DH12]|uniref:hypothetical protein n=1 Tax=Streptomyces sp. DH12 TaxID=2857010 RepID=UPI001E412E35|nr:hypothetical protein [Streptomyces sp. DH12]